MLVNLIQDLYLSGTWSDAALADTKNTHALKRLEYVLGIQQPI